MAAPAVADKADNAFMMICTALVLFMTVPIALFYGGLIRGKTRAVDADAGDRDVCTGLYSLVVYGYSLAFGEGNNFFGNINGLMLKTLN